jgi:hypothetical protein
VWVVCMQFLSASFFCVVQDLYLVVTHEVRLLLYFKLMVCFLCQGSDIMSLSLLSNTDLLTSDSQSVSISVNLYSLLFSLFSHFSCLQQQCNDKD